MEKNNCWPEHSNHASPDHQQSNAARMLACESACPRSTLEHHGYERTCYPRAEGMHKQGRAGVTTGIIGKDYQERHGYKQHSRALKTTPKEHHALNTQVPAAWL
jgi:hypothetical protein